VYIYGSYQKSKTRVPLFGPPCIRQIVQNVTVSSSVQSTTTDDELVMDDFAPHVAVIGDVYKCDSKVFVMIEKNIVLHDMSFFAE